MSEPVTDEDEMRGASGKGTTANTLDNIGWGVFFVWVGVALLLDLGWGIGLIGVGVITLGEQIARRYCGLKMESFWVIVALLFFLGGMSDMLKIQASLIPLLIIAIGVAMVISTLRKRQ